MTAGTKMAIRDKATAQVRRKLLQSGYCINYVTMAEWYACDMVGVVGRGKALNASVCEALVKAGELEPVAGDVAGLYRYNEKAVKA